MNSKQIICPKCKTAIEVDDEVYASLLSQVRNQEFDDAINKREQEIRKTFAAENEAVAARKQIEHNAALADKDAELSSKNSEIALLQKKIEGLSAEKEVEHNKQIALKDQEIAKLMEKIDGLIESQRMAVENAEARKDAEISKLQQQLKSQSETLRLNQETLLAKKDKEIADLKSSLDQGADRTKIAVLEEQQRCQQALAGKDREIANIQARMEQQASNAALTLASTKERYETQLRMKEEEVAQYRDFKLRLSTKAIGESLEVWCMNQFNRQRMLSFPNAYFGKDNEVVEGTKGDFVFRDYIIDEDGRHEYISIMFEMKNESDATVTKHTNADFFKKLDDDRRKKGCEFAVLVSMLEPDNDYYDGIVNVSYEYEKMYVVRPQYFLTIIAILSELARNNIGLKKELAAARNQSMDVAKFEADLLEFQTSFGKTFGWAHERFQDAIKGIDRTIKLLEAIKEDFTKSDNHFKAANNKTQALTIRKLTHGNPTMKALFDEARSQSSAPEIADTDFSDDIDPLS